MGPHLGHPAERPSRRSRRDPAEEAATGPASATLVVDGDVAKAVATALRDLARRRRLRTTASSGPLEDGTYVLDLTRPDGRLQGPGHGRAERQPDAVTILYGAACPHD